ncbi:hypothetical protein HYU13_02660 [Candidatus Woesearchaeota archaeon]|nr:hypothetical protein [Candidatus Woesearchaeota archaeon]
MILKQRLIFIRRSQGDFSIMRTLLLIILSLSGLLALYWVLIGQWKHNAMMRQQAKDKGSPGEYNWHER